MLSFIVAMDKNNVIGIKDENKMPWHLPRDLQYFKERTTGHTIIMGRKTFESLGRVLPNRQHIVLTRSDQVFPDEVKVIRDFNDIIELEKANPEEEIFVIGGGSIYKQLLPYADKLYVTIINESFSGDVHFPTINKDEWIELSKEHGIRDEQNPYDYDFLQYIRK